MMVIHLLNHRRVHQKALTVKIAEFLKTVGSRRHRHTTIVVALRLWTVTRGDRSQQIISGFQLPPFQRHHKLVLVMFAYTVVQPKIVEVLRTRQQKWILQMLVVNWFLSIDHRSLKLVKLLAVLVLLKLAQRAIALINVQNLVVVDEGIALLAEVSLGWLDRQVVIN